MAGWRELLVAGTSRLKQSDDSTFLRQQCIKLEEILSNNLSIDEFNRSLYGLLLNPEYTILISQCFPKFLLQILSDNISLKNYIETKDYSLNIEEKQCHLNHSVMLSKLVSHHPDVLQFCLLYFNNYPSPFEWVSDNDHSTKRRKVSILPNKNNVTDKELVQSCYRFLTFAPSVFRQKWSWSIFIKKFLTNEDIEVKWLTIQCITIVTGMSEFQSRILQKSIINNSTKIREYLLKYCNTSHNTKSEIWCDTTAPIDELKILSENVVDVAGILLPVCDFKNKQNGNLIHVKSTLDNMRSLALAIATGKAVCLIGPVGCGKTALVENLACITGRSQKYFKKVQLGDQTDARSLLGTYRCSDIPGEFIWQPGVLTQAVQQGQWILLEDIDCAALDVASVLSSLLERNILSVPGYRDSIPVAPGFQLFVTKRLVHSTSGSRKSNSNANALLEKHWTQINVEPLSRNELIIIVDKLYPALKTISSRVVDVFMLFSVGSHQSSLHSSLCENGDNPIKTRISSIDISNIILSKSGRLTSTRDLLKWCRRAIIDFSISSQESAVKVLQDAVDIFVCSLPELPSRILLAQTIGTYLGIVDTKTEYYCFKSKPCVSLLPDILHMGRAVIPRMQLSISNINLDERKMTFSYTLPTLSLLERVSCCINMKEPVLLVGETGTGKTSCIQYLARETGHKLIVINMNQQSDSADLLGGYKPVDFKFVISPIRNEFEQLFRSYFDGIKNNQFLKHISDCFNDCNWKTLLQLMKAPQNAALRRLDSENNQILSQNKEVDSVKVKIFNRWYDFGQKLNKLEVQLKNQSSLAFSFIEGSLINALKEGHWVLLDEINLASAETLECLSGLLEGNDSSISLIERGDDVPIKRHKDFILFACMNPATDVGKRDLPAGLRNRFTEFFIDELTDKTDLLLLIGDYLKDMSIQSSIVESIYKFYINIIKEAKLNLMDGTGQSPHYSLRTLCRALAAAPKTNCGTVARSLYETLCLSFLTQLDSISHPKVEKMIASAVLGKKSLKSILEQPIPMPNSKKGDVFLNFEGYWICQGKLKPIVPNDYILTPSVRKNLRDISRIISLGKLPILLQGDTSVGKTSLITYLAKASGNQCVRINNHQHTDLQEYVGSYATDSSGKLIFREGLLVEAMRKGYWIILDELNLAPTDVLEALNRVLDDNKELFIPETQQTIRADPKFMLFATQNPPGLYGGRKLLSRAFKNRFVELHFDEIPKSELETILYQRCHMPPSYCKKVISVMAELQVRRRGSAAVQGKEGFITLRDLFRWGQRYKIASNYETNIGKYYDWDQHIADEGYLVLAGRVRQLDERSIIQEVLEKHIKRKPEPDNLFSLHEKTSTTTRDILEKLLNFQCEKFNNVVWTYNMRRLAVLIIKAFHFNEPVLLVGETGCGKTTVCQILSALRECELTTVNCHMHTESSDFLGGLRPVRHYENDGKLFEWVDGPLINSMKTGQLFLADEISLADDSVLERLNSLLEPEREILLAEKGISMDDSSACTVTAVDDFRFIATMNPGGDYGKKELSPALRNRFTEVWCDHITTYEDTLAVLEKSLNKSIIDQTNNFNVCESIIDFVNWFKKTKIGERLPCNIRDLLSWIHFINETVENKNLDIFEAYLHGAGLVFLDCFGTSVSGSENDIDLMKLKEEVVNYIITRVKSNDPDKINHVTKILLNKESKFIAERTDEVIGFKPFFIKCGPRIKNTANIADSVANNFSFTAPTTGLNTLRILRGLQLKKAILLEGSPGVGKTSLVTALAKISGHKILRINLSDQTDISDLFGADLPTSEGTFAWKDGAFLTALKNGDWILLDELNLAPQPVLEGLNACFDHRGEIFISELGRTFYVKTETRIFACQNPLKQGGARRGLPKSFLNRFTQVYIDTLTPEDLLFITQSQYNAIPKDILNMMIKFNSKILKETSELLWGYKGSPWELNLRDIQRWCDGIMAELLNNEELSKNNSDSLRIEPGKFAKLLYVDRMRTLYDKEQVINAYKEIFGRDNPLSDMNPAFYISQDTVHIGDAKAKRNIDGINKNLYQNNKLMVLRSQLPALKSLMQCVQMNWLAILIGPTASGKSSCVHVLSELMGKELKTLPVTSAMDTTDILGGFEQTDYNRHLEDISMKVENFIMLYVQKKILNNSADVSYILEQWEIFKSLDLTDTTEKHTMENERNLYFKKQSQLEIIMDELLKFSIDASEINDMKNKLKHIHSLIEKEKSMNAGGKFEWVDSLLVKCLLEGSWLLIDNVNLCSSAVLDRLNGLLESHGVLSVPERGDSLDEIKPHPNFRIFFTMDPKNGEISRAMRNRGVEIYLIGSDDQMEKLCTDTLPLLDLQGLLYNAGLPTLYHSLFISIHVLMCSLIQSFEKPSQYYLLQTASLTWQQIERGENSINAIINSFSDIYIKSRSTLDFINNNQSLAESKDNMFKELKNKVQLFFEEVDNKNEYFNVHTTLSCRMLNQHIKLERIKQDSFFINIALSKTSSDETISKMSYLLYSYYNNSSFSDSHLRYEYMNGLIYDLKHNIRDDALQFYQLLNKSLFLAVKTCNTKNISNYPWNTHNLQEIKDICIDNFSSNKLNGYLYFLSVTLQRNMNKAINENMTIMDYSMKVLNNTIKDDFPEMPILRKCFEIVNILESNIKNVLNYPEVHISNEKWCELITMISWIERFYSNCNKPLYDDIIVNSKKKRVINDDSVKNLILHYKWLLKKTIKPLLNICNTYISSNELLYLINKINRSIASENSPLKSIRKHLASILGVVTAYPDLDSYKNCVERDNFFKNSVSSKFISRKFIEADIKKMTSQETNYDFEIENIFGVPNKEFVNEPDVIMDIDTCELIDEKLNENKLQTNEMICKFTYDVQLWPVKDMLFQKILCTFKNEIHLNSENVKLNETIESIFSRNSSLIQHLFRIAKSNAYLPPKLINFLSNLSTEDINPDTFSRISKYSLYIDNVMDEYQENTPYLYDSYWLNWNVRMLSDKEELFGKDSEMEPSPLYLPHLTSSTIKLALTNNISKEKDVDDLLPAALMQWNLRSKQLASLHHILWKNMILMTSEDYRQSVIDSKTVLINFERMVIALDKTILRKATNNDSLQINKPNALRDLVKNCIENINAIYEKENEQFTPEMINMKNNFNDYLNECTDLFYHIQNNIRNLNGSNLAESTDDDDIEELIKIGSMWTLLALCNITVFSEISTVDVIKKDQLKLFYANSNLKLYETLLDVDALHCVLHGNIELPNDIMEEILLCSDKEIIPNKFHRLNEDADVAIDKDSIYGNLRSELSSNIIDAKSIISERIDKSSKSIMYRPSEPSYSDISKEINYFICSLGSSEILKKHYKSMRSICEKLSIMLNRRTYGADSAGLLKDANEAIKKFNIWKYSLKKFCSRFSQKFSQVFPDLTMPFLHSISQFIYGLTILKTCLIKMSVKLKFEQNDRGVIDLYMGNLIRFPIINEKCSSSLSIIDSFASNRFLDFLKDNDKNVDDISLKKKEGYRLLKISLRELQCKCINDGSMSAGTWTLLYSILSELVAMWQKQQENIRKMKEEEDSLYVTKTKCRDPTEEEVIETELNDMFPSYVDLDFLDFKNSIEHNKPDAKNTASSENRAVANEQQQFFTTKDISFIASIHSDLVKNYTHTEWLPIPRGSKSSCDYLVPLLERYDTFSALLENVFFGMNGNIDSQILPSLLILITHVRSQVDGENYLDMRSPSSEKPNFYHSAWVEETKKCLPTLKLIKKKTAELLDLWPDFPTLKDIMVVTDRILNFPVTSPVVRFLTGLELLRDKIEDWNKSAHKGVALLDLSLLIAEHIVAWRKIELNGWKDSLNSTVERLHSEASKWWFHIFILIDCFIFEKYSLDCDSSITNLVVTEPRETNNNISIEELTKSLQQFMEKSPLAEFNLRLDILLTFHYHTINLQQSIKRDEVICVLWNIYKYYSQFSDKISHVIKEKRAPIEKKLRDFVKICTWERDLSYWAVKDLAYKAQKTLHKYMKEFEGILKGEVLQFLVVDSSDEKITESVGLWDRPKRTNTKSKGSSIYNFIFEPQHYIITSGMIKKYININSSINNVMDSENKLLLRLESLTQKAKNICKSVVSSAAYPNLIQSLDEMVTQIIETVRYLKSLEVTKSLPKNKQISQAKGFLHQKKKSLADLFRNLARLGLSYKMGLVEYSKRDGNIVNLSTSPVDIGCSFSYLKNRKCDTVLLSLWQGCELYYQRCAARMAFLSKSLVTPSQDLGIPNIERIRGFSFHFMLIVQNQKNDLPKQSQKLCHLRHQITQITDLCESKALLQDQAVSILQLNKLSDIYSTVLMTLQQFYLVLKACPADNDKNLDIAFDSAISDNSLMKANKYDAVWIETLNKTSHILSTADKQKDALNNIQRVLPSVLSYGRKNKIVNSLIVSQSQWEILDNSILTLKTIKNELSALILNFGTQSGENMNSNNPLTISLVHLDKYLEKSIPELQLPINNDAQNNEDAIKLVYQTSSEELSSQVENLVSFVLLIIQDIYKKSTVDRNEGVENITDENFDDQEESNLHNILENHLKKQLQENISSNIFDLHMSQLSQKLDSLISKLNDVIEEEISVCKKTLMNCIPLLEQLSLFAQYFVTQQIGTYRVSCKMLSVILNIFGELAARGFCSNLNTEEPGDGKEKGGAAGGMGLADGEGEKDVSDEIKNQDQLDTAQKPDEEKNKEDNKDCDEEENGVNMTDDFESHLQDVEEKEGEDDSDKDDCDKEMGDTKENVDKLDQQLWGSDDEEEEDENQKNNEEKEEEGAGKPMGDKQLEAKDDKANKEEESVNDDENNIGRKENKNDINEEEYDDDQVDPYHGDQKQLPEPEPMDLPDNMDLDNKEENNEQMDEEENKNPFEIDVMKDKNLPEEQQEESNENDKNEKDPNEKKPDDSAMSDDDNESNGDNSENPTEMNTEDNVEDDENESGDKQDPDMDESPLEEEPEEENENLPQVPDQKPNNQDTNNENEVNDEDEEKKVPEDGKSSNDTPTIENDVQNADKNDGSKDMVQTNEQIDQSKQSAPLEQRQEQDGKEEDGVGQSELSNEQKGHMGNRKDKPQINNQDKNNAEDKKQPQKRNKPGNTEEERLLGEIKEPVKKKSKTLNMQNKENEAEENDDVEGVEENKNEDEADIYQHITQGKESTTQIIDAATKDQAESQPVVNNPEDEDAETPNHDDDIEMDITENVEENDVESDIIKPENIEGNKNEEKDKKSSKGDGQEDINCNSGVDTEGDNITTSGVERGTDTSYHTKLDKIQVSHSSFEDSCIAPGTIQQSLQSLAFDRVTEGDNSMWHSLWGRTSSQARLLTEKLRLVLEPTGLSRLAGDYRTGKRINMRRVIPYIASHFRKDRIWLRRTRPARREYHIAVAIDDSSSMCDNQSKELAFESLALISQALNLLEAGDFSVLSFGEDTKILHSFNDQFTENSGSKLLQNLTFKQTKTRIAHMLDFASVMFDELCTHSNAPNAKLLLIVSDGRSIFSEGEEKVIQTLRRVRQKGVFVVYLIVDNPDNKISIMDIRVPVFDFVTNQLKSIQPYLDTFPFPFYLILRDITALPAVLSDAMRQWFELAANTDRY